jgi:hypothetical protein
LNRHDCLPISHSVCFFLAQSNVTTLFLGGVYHGQPRNRFFALFSKVQHLTIEYYLYIFILAELNTSIRPSNRRFLPSLQTFDLADCSRGPKVVTVALALAPRTLALYKCECSGHGLSLCKTLQISEVQKALGESIRVVKQDRSEYPRLAWPYAVKNCYISEKPGLRD